MDDTEDTAEESPQALDTGPTDPSLAEPGEGMTEDPETDPAPLEFEVRKPGLYVLRPKGLRPAPRAARRRLGRLRNDCPPDRRRLPDRPALKPRIR